MKENIALSPVALMTVSRLGFGKLSSSSFRFKTSFFDRTEEESLELRYIFEGHSLGVVSVDISSDGRYAVSSSLDCHIRFWDLESGSPAQDMAANIDAGPTDSWTVSFSPDASLLATGCQGGKINLFSTETGKLMNKLDTTAKFALSVAFVCLLSFSSIFLLSFSSIFLLSFSSICLLSFSSICLLSFSNLSSLSTNANS